jgi:hypothetical protein
MADANDSKPPRGESTLCVCVCVCVFVCVFALHDHPHLFRANACLVRQEERSLKL